MSSDELKSEEKRAEDAVIEKENMSKAMTAVEEKAISTTYVPPTDPISTSSDPALSALRSSQVLECRVFFAFGEILANCAPTASLAASASRTKSPTFKRRLDPLMNPSLHSATARTAVISGNVSTLFQLFPRP